MVILCLVAAVVTMAVAPTTASATEAGRGHRGPGGPPVDAPTAPEPATGAFATTKAYVEQFYPLWFTYAQTRVLTNNQLIGPDKVTAIYHGVVAINNDTLYASSPIDMGDEPVILTVPETEPAYSVLVLDAFGNVFPGLLPSKASGVTTPETVYALTAPGWSGDLPDGVTVVEMPLPYMFLIFRVDRFTPEGVDQTAEGNEFRAALRLQPLSGYLDDPSGGTANILPEFYFAIPFKTIADFLANAEPLTFLRQLQAAVHSSNTPPLTPDQQAASDAFDELFGTGDVGGDEARASAFRAGTRAAHAAIVDNYLGNLGPNNWIHFTNMGNWGDNALDRSSISEFIQYGNGIDTAAYYHTFRDGDGAPLVGSTPGGYVLTFPPGGQPAAERFWSVTAYTPDTIELIPNDLGKYLVGSYTPGLETAPDGSVSIYLSPEQPEGVPEANWLPVSDRPFNIMLRVYGVVAGSSVADNTYVPPPVVRAG